MARARAGPRKAEKILLDDPAIRATLFGSVTAMEQPLTSRPTKSFSPRAFSGWALDTTVAARTGEGPAQLADRLDELGATKFSFRRSPDEQIARVLIGDQAVATVLSSSSASEHCS